MRIEGTTFRREDGSIWKYRPATGFTAFQDFLNGRDLDPYVRWVRSVGCNGLRVFHTWVVTDFCPLRNLGREALQRELLEFRKWADARAMFLHNVAFCDQVNGSSVLMSSADQDIHLECLRVAMQGRMLEAVNEDWKNGQIASRFRPEQFTGTFGTRSSWQDGENPSVCGSVLDFTTEHNPRDNEWPRKAKNMLETSVQGIGSFPATRRPAVCGEPIAIFHSEKPERTTNDTDVADYFATAELFSAGACLHGDGSELQRCIVPDDRTTQLALAAKAGREAVPVDAQLGSYTRGYLDDCPLVHDDAKALRTFGMIQGDRATMVVVRPTADWRLETRAGWKVSEQRGLDGHVILVTR